MSCTRRWTDQQALLCAGPLQLGISHLRLASLCVVASCACKHHAPVICTLVHAHRHVKPENVTLIDQSPHQLEKARAKRALQGVTIMEVCCGLSLLCVGYRVLVECGRVDAALMHAVHLWFGRRRLHVTNCCEVFLHSATDSAELHWFNLQFRDCQVKQHDPATRAIVAGSPASLRVAPVIY